jgi:hypothetical protein
MKFLPLLLLSMILTASSDAQQVRAPVNVAFNLYTGCIRGEYMGARIEPTKSAIKAFVEGVDHECLAWTIIWYKPMMGDIQDISDWDMDKINRFESLRKSTLVDMTTEIQEILGVKK